jgi:hypothetical protein
VSRRLAPWLLGGAGLALAVALALIATPARIWEYARHATWPGPAVAFAWAVVIAGARGVRLSLLVGRRTPGHLAVAAATVAQLAVAILPWRVGELALVPALRAAGMPGTLRAVSVLVAIRVLDVATLLAWGVAAAVLLGAPPGVAPLALAGLGGAVWLAWRAGGAVLARVAAGWRRPTGPRRVVLRHALQARRQLRQAGRSPARLGGAVACSLLAWAGVWGLCVALVRSMGFGWPAGAVLLAVIGASLAAVLPINAVGSFGTLEAGWALRSPRPARALASLPAGSRSPWSLVASIVWRSGSVVAGRAPVDDSSATDGTPPASGGACAGRRHQLEPARGATSRGSRADRPGPTSAAAAATAGPLGPAGTAGTGRAPPPGTLPAPAPARGAGGGGAPRQAGCGQNARRRRPVSAAAW